ncbi:redoxin domain-containing protein [Brachybacterium huguangmaarense]|uniref:Redoxin domain-containing protein n=1 Tax=Brachybacterium huguangmaarense TaxID=1652028 RepID=A0ABY6G0K9_9MICO|nr:redoxin domain-containing protein [Brachybacterium huguangmaarense]UYG16213.1 redoxin domain-containing protein [Brachybacterium huguangmaarense]
MTVLVSHEGADVDLADLAGVPHAMVLFPGAFTPTCTRELSALDALWQELGEQGVAVPVLAVACDAPPVLAAWREAEGVGVPLLSDFWPHGALSRELDAFDESTGRARRTSVVIGADGQVAWRDDAPPGAARDMARLAAVLRDL